MEIDYSEPAASGHCVNELANLSGPINLEKYFHWFCRTPLDWWRREDGDATMLEGE